MEHRVTDAPNTVDAGRTVEERVRAIRASLPGQVKRQQLEAAELAYGPLYTQAAIERKVAETLPHRLGYRRGATSEPVETYAERIPDDALLKYADAVDSGLFARFAVVTPTYREERQVDPWLVGEVADTGRLAIIAHWA